VAMKLLPDGWDLLEPLVPAAKPKPNRPKRTGTRIGCSSAGDPRTRTCWMGCRRIARNSNRAPLRMTWL
jgi:hypothetical protein